MTLGHKRVGHILKKARESPVDMKNASSRIKETWEYMREVRQHIEVTAKIV